MTQAYQGKEGLWNVAGGKAGHSRRCYQRSVQECLLEQHDRGTACTLQEATDKRPDLSLQTRDGKVARGEDTTFKMLMAFENTVMELNIPCCQ